MGRIETVSDTNPLLGNRRRFDGDVSPMVLNRLDAFMLRDGDPLWNVVIHLET